MSLISVKNLTVAYQHGRESVTAVKNVDFEIEKGQTLGLVGKSGCGKSTVALALMGLLPEKESQILSGTFMFENEDLLAFDQDQWRSLRGQKIAMIFQDPFSSLNPVLKSDFQLQEAIELLEGQPNHMRATELLDMVQLKDPERILNSYPHQLSGGQRQRVMIAMALSQNPQFLIADEPTTALDVTVQAEIMALLKDLQKKLNMALLFITHNMGLVKDISDDLGVMFRGKIVERGKTKKLLSSPQHPYTIGLLNCIPKLKPEPGPIPVLDEAYLEG